VKYHVKRALPVTPEAEQAIEDLWVALLIERIQNTGGASVQSRRGTDRDLEDTRVVTTDTPSRSAGVDADAVGRPASAADSAYNVRAAERVLTPRRKIK
jgi:hypothetical protein